MIILSNLKAEEYKNFEKIKKIREDGTEYWNARELSEVLQYKKWENFAKVIDRAKLACNNSGFEIIIPQYNWGIFILAYKALILADA